MQTIILHRDFYAVEPYEKLTTDITELKIGDEKENFFGRLKVDMHYGEKFESSKGALKS